MPLKKRVFVNKRHQIVNNQRKKMLKMIKTASTKAFKPFLHLQRIEIHLVNLWCPFSFYLRALFHV